MGKNISASTEIIIITFILYFEKSFHDFDIDGYETILVPLIDFLYGLLKMVKFEVTEF